MVMPVLSDSVQTAVILPLMPILVSKEEVLFSLHKTGIILSDISEETILVYPKSMQV